MTSPRLLGRTIALLFLFTIVTGIIAQGFISERLLSGSADTVAENILTHRGLYLFGFTVYLLEMASQVVTAALWYILLRPVNRSVALSAAFLELSGCIIKSFARVFYIVPLYIVAGGGPAHALDGLTTQQLQAIALISFHVNNQGAGMALAFFGFSTILNGYLIFRSTFLPRWLGVLAMISGLGWLTFIYPPLGYGLFLFAALIGLLSSVVMIVRLLIGVNEERWKECAKRTAA